MSDLPGPQSVGGVGGVGGQTAEEHALAAEVAAEAQRYLDTVTEVAAGTHEDALLSILLLATSRVLEVGARLGAMSDVLPQERFEPDAGPEHDFSPMLVGLGNELAGLADYVDLVDPVTTGERTGGDLANDLITVAEQLSRPLAHYRAGNVDEALWWWQFSYLSNWGERAATAHRVLLGLLSHVRLDADDEVVADAEFDSLHR